MIALLPTKISVFSAVYRTTLWMDHIDEAAIAHMGTAAPGCSRRAKLD